MKRPVISEEFERKTNNFVEENTGDKYTNEKPKDRIKKGNIRDGRCSKNRKFTLKKTIDKLRNCRHDKCSEVLLMKIDDKNIVLRSIFE